MTAGQIASLQSVLLVLVGRLRPYFNRQVTCEHFKRHMLGLMADLKRRSIEPIALATGVC